ncbi:MAG: tetratricopeptide repeat protein [Kofleriaceae bacterium]
MQAALSLLAGVALALAPGVAVAEPKTASEWFNLGDNHYNLGEFAKAIEAFRKAFEIEKDEALKPIYLYNIAQSYRQAGDCDNAVFFYKRFLSLKANDTKKPLEASTKETILKRIEEQEKICAEKNSNRDKPPEGTMRPENGAHGDSTRPADPEIKRDDGDPGESTKRPSVNASVSDEDPEEDPEDELTAGVTGQAKVVALRLGLGVGIPNLDPVAVAKQFSSAVVGGYPIPLTETASVEVGAALGLSPLQWDDDAGGTQTSLFVSAVANAGLRLEVMPKLSLRGDLGIGALFFTNVAAGNPFTEGGQAAAGGALTMFHLRVGAGVEYAATESISVWASPFTFGYSPAKAGLLSDSITQISFLAGAGYRM